MLGRPSTLRAERGSRRAFVLRLLLFLGGLALLVVFVSRIGLATIVAELRHAGANAFWIFVPYALGTAIGALPWAAFLPRGARPSLRASVAGRFVASSANSILPFFGIAGEPSRLLWLPERVQARGVAALVVDRLLYNAGNGLLLALGSLAGYLATEVPRSLALAGFVIAALTLGVTVGACWLVPRFGIGTRLHALLERALARRYGTGDFGVRVDRELFAILRSDHAKLVRGAGVHTLGRGVLALEIPIGLLALGARVSPAEAAVLAVVPIALSFFFSSVPGLIGIQEGAQTLIASALHLDAGTVLAVVLLQRFRQLVFAALMPVLLAFARAAPSDQNETLKSR